MRFAYPLYLLLLLILPVLWWRMRHGRTASGPMIYSDVRRIKEAFGVAGRPVEPFSHRIRRWLYSVRLLILALLILALARPQAEIVLQDVKTEGVDIVLAIDVSGSMEIIDLDAKGNRTRLEVTKEVVRDFIEGRTTDRIGMLVYAAQAYTQCPLTVDYGILKNFLDQVHINMVDPNRTAIGMALANCVNRFRGSEAKSKVIILLSDGENNAGEIDPITAAELAKAVGVKVYTIGIGGYGTGYIRREVMGEITHIPQQVSMDEEVLRRIAETTGGKYYRATDRASFQKIFQEIDSLEKTTVQSRGHRRFEELFLYFAVPALILLIIEIVLTNTRFRKLP
ncbi:MAG TPA: VWA domain-containing protein [bacterium]|nr:VWA domain-containing protein [bacterium]HQL63319.1 VWA domain-containing protein [bacterium]